MGSEMCIRDRHFSVPCLGLSSRGGEETATAPDASLTRPVPSMHGLLRRAGGDMGEFTNSGVCGQCVLFES